MNRRELQITKVERAPAPPIEVAATPETASPSPWRRIHRVLRGRYPLAEG